MKNLLSTKFVKLTGVLLLAALAGITTPTVRGADVSDNIYNYLELLRSDVNSIKVDLVNSIMKLSAEEAKKFWPIYREYENDLGKLAIERAELVTGFVQSHKDGSFDEAKAKVMAKDWFKSQRARLDLLEKYHTKLLRALTPIHAAQFLQIENQIGLFIDVAIASEMPTIGTADK